MNTNELHSEITSLKDSLPADRPPINGGKIRETAERLRMMSYSPTLGGLDVDILELGRGDVVRIMDGLTSAGADYFHVDPGISDTDLNAVRAEHARLLADHYRLLFRLRNEEPEAWDTVNELYSDD